MNKVIVKVQNNLLGAGLGAVAGYYLATKVMHPDAKHSMYYHIGGAILGTIAGAYAMDMISHKGSPSSVTLKK